MVLSSREVAYAASAPGTGLIDIPGDGETLPVAVTGNEYGITLSDVSSPACTSGELIRSYSWRINDFNLDKRGWRLLINEPGSDNTIMGVTGAYSIPNLNHGTVELRKANKNQPKAKKLSNGDSYDISLMVTWQCSGANSYAQAEYRFIAAYPTLPQPAFDSYTVT